MEPALGEGGRGQDSPGARGLTAAPSRASLESATLRDGQPGRPAPASSPEAVPCLLAAPSLGTHFQPESDPDPTSLKPFQSP